jgi:hypothetical protein
MEIAMHARFEAYRHTELGSAIEALAEKSERMTEYALLSRLEMPAVIALSWDVAPLLVELSEGDRRDAKQYCGAIVGDIMREHGYEIANPRGSAQAGGVFTLGAVWAPAKHVKAMEVARRGFKKYTETFKTLAK